MGEEGREPRLRQEARCDWLSKETVAECRKIDKNNHLAEPAVPSP